MSEETNRTLVSVFNCESKQEIQFKMVYLFLFQQNLERTQTGKGHSVHIKSKDAVTT